MSNKKPTKIDYTNIPILGVYDKHLAHYEKMKKLLKAHQTKTASLALRRKWLNDSNVYNYQNEYERIRGVLSKNNPGLGQQTIERLQQREDELRNLGAQAVNKIP